MYKYSCFPNCNYLEKSNQETVLNISKSIISFRLNLSFCFSFNILKLFKYSSLFTCKVWISRYLSKYIYRKHQSSFILHGCQVSPFLFRWKFCCYVNIAKVHFKGTFNLYFLILLFSL